MPRKKYLKGRDSLVRAIATDNLQLEKPLTSENYDIDVHNRNMEKIDKGVKEAKDIASSKAPQSHTHNASDIQGLSMNAKDINYDNKTSQLKATNTQGVIDEVNTKAEENKKNISSHNTRLSKMETELNGARLDLINTSNSIINKIV